VTTRIGLDYIAAISITEAFYVYEVKFEINGVPMPQTCRLSLISDLVDVSKSTALLI